MKLKKNIGKLTVKGLGVITPESLDKDPSLAKRAIALDEKTEQFFETNKKTNVSDSKD